MSTFDFSDRLQKLPPYLFAKIDELKWEVIQQGHDVIDLGVGDPDLPTPDHIIDRLAKEAKKPENHRYPAYTGSMDFREAISDYYSERHGVTVDAATEIITLIGSKEGIGHFPVAFLNPSDVVLVPNPAYPVYEAGTILAGGDVVFMPLLRENGFLPHPESIEPAVLERTKILWINYPNNPTAATAPVEFFEKVVTLAREYNFIVAHDAAYSEVSYEGYRAPSLLQVEGAMDVGIEFGSLSKTYNMTGWRVAYAAGNKKLIAGLGKVKQNMDSGAFQAVQYAGIEALKGPQDCVNATNEVYRERRDILVEGLKNAGWDVDAPKAAFYLWIPVPEGYTSSEVSSRLITEAHVIATPGNGFGSYGEGYIRLTLTAPTEQIKEAVQRISRVSF